MAKKSTKKPRAPKKPAPTTTSSSSEPVRDAGGTIIPTSKGKAGKGAKQSFLPEL